jgi:hypothetical protein
VSRLFELMDDPCLWTWYCGASAVISLTVGIAWWWRQRDARWPEKLHGVIWNGVVQLFGFFLLFLQVFLLTHIVTSDRTATQVIFGVIYFPVFFYTLFCISGRGVEVLQRISDSGIREIRITWSGIHIALGGQDHRK